MQITLILGSGGTLIEIGNKKSLIHSFKWIRWLHGRFSKEKKGENYTPPRLFL